MPTTEKSELTEIFATIDAKDVETGIGWFAEEASAVFGSNPILVGREQIHAGLVGFYQTIAGLEHTIGKTWGSGAEVVVESQVTYDRLDGRQVTIPAVSILERNAADEIISYRVYFDPMPVYAP